MVPAGPPLAHLAGIHDALGTAAIVLAGMAYAAAIGLLHPRRQFLHDMLCGTQLIHWKAAPELKARPQTAESGPHDESAQRGRTGLDRIVRATGYSMSGLAMAYRGESAFRQEFWLAVILLPAAFWLGRSWVEVALLAGSVLLVLIVELLNPGIEAAIDRISFEMHDLSKRARIWPAPRCWARCCCAAASGWPRCGNGATA